MPTFCIRSLQEQKPVSESDTILIILMVARHWSCVVYKSNAWRDYYWLVMGVSLPVTFYESSLTLSFDSINCLPWKMATIQRISSEIW